MSQPFQLQALLDLAKEGSNAAAARLGVVNGRQRDMQTRLQTLQDYRAEYAERLARMAQDGLDSLGWRNFREFIDKIDVAIEMQLEVLVKASADVESGQRDWRAQQCRLKSFDTLSQRHLMTERRKDARREQKEQDEHALKGFLERRVSLG